jgi:hypothetical protein
MASADKWLEKWGLPANVRQSYARAGVQQLFEWQVHCLETTGALDGRNLVYSAPTVSPMHVLTSKHVCAYHRVQRVHISKYMCIYVYHVCV